MPLLFRALSAASVALRDGSSDNPVPVIQKMSAARIASRSNSNSWITRSGAFGKR
jgi:hypothetical protein